MGKRGQQPREKPMCKFCGVDLNHENAYYRVRNGLEIIVDYACKACSADRVYIRIWRKKSFEEIDKQLEQLKKEKRNLEQALKEKTYLNLSNFDTNN